MAEFRVGEDDFEVDGRPVRLLSGALHYFRVHEEQWPHRLRMLRAMGLNCVETYVPWNLHEPRPGEVDDVAAVGRFLDAAHEAGLWVIARPGPYICAEWENGGLPHWLTGPLGSRIRSRDAEFLAAVERWFRVLLPQIVERQVDRGGPVIMVQVENEYGSYGSDQLYLRALADLLLELGVTVPLFTSDGPEDHMLSGGSVPGILATANFGSRARESFETLRRHRPKGPLMCAEFWCGWFDHWGAGHTTRDARDAARTLEEILACGASVNLYMAHGGTSFGGWAGANRGGGALHSGALEADVTSYDYDAPIDEFGRPTEKFWLFREVFARYAVGPLPDVPVQPAALGAPVTVEATAYTPLAEVLEALGGPESEHAVPPSFEDLDVDRGLVRYAVTVPGPRKAYELRARELRDLAVVYVDGERAGVLTEESPVLATPVSGHARVELWVESLGRVNYGPRLGEVKGIVGGVLHERQFLHGVRARGLRLDAFTRDAVAGLAGSGSTGSGLPGSGLAGSVGGAGLPGLYRGAFEVAVGGAGDASLELPGWTRGFVWVNGFCLGRYWGVGPQETLYVPGPVVRDGVNEVWVLELDGVTEGARVRLG
ncbi:beta-galactosidase family protein [Streptomyces sp. VRA16 Mangrove soil]|uniref:glycoside hydrolase family 35 protein n=1 Tax=Streptomyces sp. VRA16 Mangrove soil TaxID=2817434 RepID=UPI001A9E8CC4|nr:beta-galactosidase family protein [Streptomyces sp. VRA16 Mangrove soil]MBO1335433.1 beta-galactosidase [Streptomyces sp. VRA16 Mangrove soil]